MATCILKQNYSNLTVNIMTSERKRPTIDFMNAKTDSHGKNNDNNMGNNKTASTNHNNIDHNNNNSNNKANAKNSDYENAKEKLKQVIDDFDSDNNDANSMANDTNTMELQKQIKESREQIEKLQQRNNDLEKKLMYLAAEYENNKKRATKDVEDASKFSITKFATDAIKIYDVLLTAIDNVNTENTDKILYDGVKMTISEFNKMFEKTGMKCINPEVGSTFDHNKHEAISRIESDIEIGSIVKVIRVGYEIYGRLLRPAMVVVSSGK